MDNPHRDLTVRAASIAQDAICLTHNQRMTFLDLQCKDDPALRLAVEQFLTEADATSDLTGSLLEPDDRTSDAGGIFAPLEIAPGTYVGNYKVIRFLGRGGMGQVLLARQENPHREVALKMLRAELFNETLHRRFQLESEILGRMNHPGIAQIFEAGTTADGHSYFAMEYVPGLPLGSFARQEVLDVPTRLEMACQICEAVHHAHTHGVIHRDLKPSNILALRQAGGEIRTRILDFGVARASGPTGPMASIHTIPGQLVGTLNYMSPEQVGENSDDIDPRSDIYQLGVIFYELLADQLPLDLRNMGYPQALRRIAEDTPVPLDVLNPAFRGDIEIIIGKAMAKDRRERYRSAEEMGADIRRHLDGEPILARSATPLYRLGKSLRKKRRSLLGLAVVASLAVVALWYVVSDRPIIRPRAPVLTRLTTSADKPVSYSSLSLSPDGRKLVYSFAGRAMARDMATGQSLALPIVGTPEPRKVITTTWHPDGTTLFVEAKLGEGEYQLFSYRPDDQTEQELLTYGEAAHPVVSPDGRLVLLEWGQDHDLVVMELATGALDTVLQVGPESTIASPAWAPDSHHLAYIRIHEPTLFLETISLDGDLHVVREDRLLNFYAQRATMTWLPDGRLVFSRFRDMSRTGVDLLAQPMDVAAGTAEGESLHLCAVEDRALLNLTYSAVTNTLAFGGHRKARKLVLFDLAQEAPLQYADLTTRGWPCLPVDWLQDGQTLVLEETNSTRDFETLLINVLTGDIAPFECCPANARPLGLMPDRRHLVVQDGQRLVAVPLDCGPIIDLGFEVESSYFRIEVQSPRPGAGPACLLVLHGSEILVRTIDLANGVGPVIRRLPFEFANIFSQRNTWADLAPDGSRFVAVQFGENIEIDGFAASASVAIPTDLGLIQEARWSGDGSRIFCQGALGPVHPRWLVRFDPESRVSELLWNSDGFESIVRPAPSPDGRYLAAQTLTLGVDFFVLEGL
ncbi:MAG: protein kinase [Candidatus Krumholzibacteria bacterium]|nr:protein kinase [Candidatus Krumholzibacteria bacterium]